MSDEKDQTDDTQPAETDTEEAGSNEELSPEGGRLRQRPAPCGKSSVSCRPTGAQSADRRGGADCSAPGGGVPACRC